MRPASDTRLCWKVLDTLMMLVAAVLVGCNQASTPPTPPIPPMPGGYAAVGTGDPEVRAAAEFAVSDQSKLGPKLKLVSIQSAARQVVAGTNLSINMIVDDGTQKKPATAVVYTDLQQVQSVSAWAWR